MPYTSLRGSEHLEEDEEEEEQDIEEGTGYNDFDIPPSQRRVQPIISRNRKTSPAKNVSFETRDTQWPIDGDREEQIDADAAHQLQIEDRQARSSGSRLTRSRSPAKRSVSKVDSHRDLEETVNQARRSTSRGPVPAPALSREIPGEQMNAQSRFSHSTLPENLTPQERKDNELDAEVMETLDNIRSDIYKLCSRFFGRDITGPNVTKMLDEIEDNDDLEFINFSKAVAEGGGVARTWQQVVAERECRIGLSYGIIHRVLVRHVFGSLLFGGPEDLMNMLERMEKAQENEDGFYREEQRALCITSYEIQYRRDVNQSNQRQLANLKLALQISMLLDPLYHLDPQNETREFSLLQSNLISIVATAAKLATLMRRSGNTVLYQFGHVFKDQVADKKTMQVLNFVQLEKQHQEGNGPDRVLIRMVCGDSLYAFRKGGGVMAERTLEKEEQEQATKVAPELRHLPPNHYRGRLITARDGYRSKFLAKAQVVGRLERIGSESKATELTEAIRLLRDGGCTAQ
ncbi:hypothetical protein KCU81_g672, partial [Aureobasidium melanogenum]|uniref:Uncharacterized protein n=1 Tax=Aureobasidium melanogenum (strain CBS 110374) TaxID=1043003 RepID=A0A074W6T6_AURM1